MKDPASAVPDDHSVVRAAGGIVVRAGDTGGWEVALVHRPEHLDWTFPKGKIESGESPSECTLREVAEETGYRCHLGRFTGEVEYLDRHGRVKIVSYWLMQPIDGVFAPTAEVDELRWLSFGDAARLLDYAHDRELLESIHIPLSSATE